MPSRRKEHLREVAVLLEKSFADFGLSVKVVGIHTGPVITQYEVALETGLRVNKVTTLADDLALNLKVPSVRIVAPIPGKNTVGIEVPNEHRAIVRIKELLLATADKAVGSHEGERDAADAEVDRSDAGAKHEDNPANTGGDDK